MGAGCRKSYFLFGPQFLEFLHKALLRAQRGQTCLSFDAHLRVASQLYCKQLVLKARTLQIAKGEPQVIMQEALITCSPFRLSGRSAALCVPLPAGLDTIIAKGFQEQRHEQPAMVRVQASLQHR